MLGIMDTESVFGAGESAPHFVQIARMLAVEILEAHGLQGSAQRLSEPTSRPNGGEV